MKMFYKELYKFPKVVLLKIYKINIVLFILTILIVVVLILIQVNRK